MGEPVRLLVLSGLGFHKSEHHVSEPLRADLLRDLATLPPPDVVCLTGDLVAPGHVEALPIALQWLQQGLLPGLGLTDERCVVVPGLADLDPQAIVGTMERDFLKHAPRKTPTEVASVLTDPEQCSRLFTPLQAFQRMAQQLGPRADTPWFSHPLDVRGTALHLAGLCSVWCHRPSEPSDGRALVSPCQARAVLPSRDVRPAPIVVALMHHAPGELTAADRRDTIHHVVHNSARLLLHGHGPTNAYAPAPGPGKPTVRIGVGRRGYALVALHPSSAGQVWFRTWSDANDRWQPDVEIAQTADGSISFDPPASSESSASPSSPDSHGPLLAALAPHVAGLSRLMQRLVAHADLVDLTVELSAQSTALQEPAFQAGRRATEAWLTTDEVLQGQFQLKALLRHDHRHWLVLGDPGSGKTTALRSFAATLIRQGTAAVYLKCARLAKGGIGTLLDELGSSEEDFRTACAQGKGVLLLDGLDEVEDPAALATRLLGVRHRYADTPILVGSRPLARSPEGLRAVQLCPLPPEARRQLLTNLLPQVAPAVRQAALERLEHTRHLRELAGNPLVLTLVADLIRQGVAVPERRVELYREVLKSLMTKGVDWHADAPFRARWTVAAQALAQLILAVHGQVADAIPTDALDRALAEAPAEIRQAVAHEGGLVPFLARCERAGVLVPDTGDPRDADAWTFAHRTFREYLAATAFGSAPSDVRERVVVEALAAPATWAEVLALATGLMDDADGFVAGLAERGESAQPLLLRLLVDAEGLSEETVQRLLPLPAGRVTGARDENAEQRLTVLRRLSRVMQDSTAVVDVARWHGERASQAMARGAGELHGGDLWFAVWVCKRVAAAAPSEAVREQARAAAEDLLDGHLPKARTDVLRQLRAHWCLVEPGIYVVGSPETEPDRQSWEQQHQVELAHPLEVQAFAVTNALYERFDPSHAAERAFADQPDVAEHPVANVTWWEAMAFAAWLGQGIRLPTETEWEVAARGGTTTAYHSGNGEEQLAQVGWYGANGDGRTHRVGEKGQPNAFGLHDVHGNVWEWCLDPWDRDRFAQQAQQSPFELSSAPFDLRLDPVGGRVIRGGSFAYEALRARSAYRVDGHPGNRYRDQGLRLVRSRLPSPGRS